MSITSPRAASALASLAAGVVLVASLPAAAQAQSAPFSRFMLEFDGGYMFSDGARSPFADHNDGGAPLVRGQTDDGWTGSVRAGTNLWGQWDAVLGYSYLRTTGNGGEAPNDCSIGPLYGNYDDCFDSTRGKFTVERHVADFEAGYNFKMDGMMLRPFAGVRYANFDQKADISYNYQGGNEATVNRKVRYWGIGPRIGINGDVDLSKDGMFFLTGRVSGAVLFGKQKRTSDTNQTDNGVFENAYHSSESSSRPVWNGQGELGIGYRLPISGTDARLVIGYRAEYWSGVNNTANENDGDVPANTYGNRHADQLFLGPFARVRIAFGTP